MADVVESGEVGVFDGLGEGGEEFGEFGDDDRGDSGDDASDDEEDDDVGEDGGEARAGFLANEVVDFKREWADGDSEESGDADDGESLGGADDKEC